MIRDWRKSRKKPQKDDAPKNIFQEAVSAPWERQVRKEEKTWDAQKEKTPHNTFRNVVKGISALKKDMQLKKAYPQKTPKKKELWEIKDYFREKKQRPKYSFTPPKKPTFTKKEVDRKMDDIKKRLMQRDKGENR